MAKDIWQQQIPGSKEYFGTYLVQLPDRVDKHGDRHVMYNFCNPGSSKDICRFGNPQEPNYNADIINELNSEDEPALKNFCYDIMSDLYKGVRKKGETSHELDRNTADQLFRYFFTGEATSYSATTYRIPSNYMDVRGKFLEHHIEFVKRKNLLEYQSCRIFIQKEKVLISDRKRNRRKWGKFLDAHKNIGLFYIDPGDIRFEIIANKHPKIKYDIGLWRDKYAVQFGKDMPEDKIILAYKDENTQSDYFECEEFINELEWLVRNDSNCDLRRLQEPPDPTDNFSQELAQKWSTFVDGDRRWKPYENFFREIFMKYHGLDYKKKKIKILDTAGGIGSESFNLKVEMSDCFEVYYNEESCNLFTVSKNELEKRLAGKIEKLHPTNLGWNLLKGLYYDIQFDVVLVLGNAISHVRSEDDIRRFIGYFDELLTPDGLLIIDHRNFEKIKDLITYTKSDKYFDAFNKSLNRRVNYCGNKYFIWPIEYNADNNKITFAHGPNKDEEQREKLEMYAFDNKTFEDILWSKITDVQDIQVYHDLYYPNTVGDINENNKTYSNPDFIHYVVKKNCRSERCHNND